MNFSRRDILKGAAATLLTGATSLAISPAPARAVGGGATPPATGVDELSQQAFAAAVGTDFHVHVGAMQTATLRLASVADLVTPPGSPAPAPGKEGFSLLFTGTPKHGFPQGTYTLDSARLGSFPLFLVAVGAAGSTTSYEAVVNRLWP
ncbi:MAG TPA: twin-arginine translocation signal domain-containing protein [Candidatus Dormibacteraeota bacterium]